MYKRQAQEGKKSELQQWKDFIENARLIARQERHLMDSIVHIKAENALQDVYKRQLSAR